MLGEGKQNKAIKDNLQNKATVHFTWGLCPLQICIYADIITISDRNFAKRK
jgi:hypothetical protein